METTTKLAVVLSTLCCFNIAFAGGPEVPMLDMNGFHMGVGGAYKGYRFSNTNIDTFFPTRWETNYSINQFGPVGELGYTFAGDQWIFGIKGQFEYDNAAISQPTNSVTFNSANFELNSHVTAMLLGGIKANDTNVVYLEGGYTAMMGKSVIYNVFQPGAGTGNAVSAEYTLNGGIVGAGWRHYFMHNVFL